jgi:FkbM family methyltransferase
MSEPDPVDPSNLFQAIHRADPRFRPRRIFDVGANIGQTVARIRAVYPHAPIDAFEPVAATFESLAAATADDEATQVHRLALSARPGVAVMSATPGSQQNRVLPAGSAPPAAPQEQVELITGDQFCARNTIREVGILKIDAEGHDLDVLVGFHTMLAQRRIHYVIVECGILPSNRTHVPLWRLTGFLSPCGYELVGLYPANLPRRVGVGPDSRPSVRGMRYGNAIFVAEPWPRSQPTPPS